MALLGTVGCLAAAKHAPNHPFTSIFFTVGADLYRTCSAGGWLRRSHRVDVDRRRLVKRRLNRVAVMMHLDELAPVGGPAPGGRDGRRFKRLAESLEDFPNRARLGDERDESDVAAAPGGTQGETPPPPEP